MTEKSAYACVQKKSLLTTWQLSLTAGGIRSLFALADFRQTLEDRLNIPVDVVTSDIDDRDFLRAIARDFGVTLNEEFLD